jgi:hypothetical protein
MRHFPRLIVYLGLFVSISRTVAAADLEFDHVWIVVNRDAPERFALERAGFKISPNINRNDGQGTASGSAEFFNAYIELMWPDSTVPVAPGAERGVEKFKNRMNWRTSGWCPIGIALHRTGRSTTLPFSNVVDRAGVDARWIGNRNIDAARRYEESILFHRTTCACGEGGSESQAS